MLNKWTIFFSSASLVGLLLIANWIGTFKLCGGIEYGSCMDFAYGVIVNFIPIIPVLIFSLITYWMREDVYRAWFKFVRWWIPLSMLAIFLAPEYSSSVLSEIDKGTVTVITSLLFAAISLAIIAAKYISHRSKH